LNKEIRDQHGQWKNKTLKKWYMSMAM
jgi:hypothetical protein